MGRTRHPLHRTLDQAPTLAQTPTLGLGQHRPVLIPVLGRTLDHRHPAPTLALAPTPIPIPIPIPTLVPALVLVLHHHPDLLRPPVLVLALLRPLALAAAGAVL